MTIIGTDAPGVTVEITSTVPVTNHAAQVRLQAWFTGDESYPLLDLRLTPEQAEATAEALESMAAIAATDNRRHGARRLA